MVKKFETPQCEFCNPSGDALFGELEQETREEISHGKGCNFYKKKQIIFYEGNHPFGIYCINQGKIKIYKISESGKEQIIRFAKEGDILGYRSLISGEPYRASAETLTDSVVCFIPKEIMFGLIEKDRPFSLKFMRFLCAELGSAENRMLNLSQKPVTERLAEMLLILKEKFGLESDNQTIKVSLTREDLASFTGTATETVVRLLKDLKEKKLIDVEGRKIKLLNINGLIKLGKVFD
jgi:CRP-like cAMP-binding protein